MTWEEYKAMKNKDANATIEKNEVKTSKNSIDGMSWQEYKQKREEQRRIEEEQRKREEEQRKIEAQKQEQKRQEIINKQTSQKTDNVINNINKGQSFTELQKAYGNLSMTEQAALAKKLQEETKMRQTQPTIPLYSKETIEKQTGEKLADAKYAQDYSNSILQPSAAFKDGYQVGDITKTAVSTLGDAAWRAIRGIANVGESMGDSFSYKQAKILDKMGKHEKAETIRANARETSSVKKDIDRFTRKAGTYSVLGGKSKNLGENLGYIAAIAAISSLGGEVAGALGGTETAATVGATLSSSAATFSSAMGQGITEAYNEGANDEEAYNYGVISGTGEMLTELMFGGIGKGSKAIGLSKSGIGVDDALAKKVGSIFKNQLAKNFAEYSIKASGEGVEEVVSGIIQAVGKKVTYMSDAELSQLLKDQHLLEQFVDGAVISAISSAPGLVTTTMAGQDYIQDETPMINQIQELQKAQEALPTARQIQEIPKATEVAPRAGQAIENTEIAPAATQENTYSNKLKQLATEEINKSNISSQDKTEMLNVLKGLDTVTDADIEAIRNTIQGIKESQQLETKGDYKNDQTRRQKYMQYKNDTSTYDSTAIDEVLDTIPQNRNGRRTVKQWLQAADEIGKRIANLSNEEIEKIAYKSWFDIQPSKSITQYDNVAHKPVNFQKFTSDEWVNTINKAVNEARANDEVQENTNNTSLELPKNINYDDSINHVKDIFDKYSTFYTKNQDIDGGRDRINEFSVEHYSDYDDWKNNNVEYLKRQGLLTTDILNIDNNLVKLTTTREDNKLYINELYVEKQKQGVGSKVMKILKDYANKAGLQLDTDRELSTSKGFWDKTLNRANTTELPVINQEKVVETTLPTAEENNIDAKTPKNLIESAKKYNLKYQNSNLAEIQTALENKGISVRFDDAEFKDSSVGAMWKLSKDENGNVKREIVLNPNANEKTVVQEMAIHELTHDIVAKNTNTSKNLYKEVKQWLEKDSDYQEQLSNLKEIYGEELAEEEAIAKTLQTKFGTQEEINNLVNYNPSMARKIYDWVVDKLNKITGGKIEKLYWEDVKNKFERAYSEEGNYNNSNTKYHISENFINEIEKSLKGKIPSNNQIKARDYTPKVLVDNGVKDLPMLLTQKHLRQIVYTQQEAENLGYIIGKKDHYHGLGKETLIKAIDNMDTPSEIYKQSDNNYLIITELKDNNNNQIIIPIQINGTGTYNDVRILENQISTVYGHEKLNKYLSDNNFEQIYKKNRSYINSEGVKSHDSINASTNSITSSKENVNTTDYNMQKSQNNTQDNQGRTLSKQQQEYFKNSKATNENGQLEVVYHGTNKAGFTEFNRNWNYYTNNKEMAQTYTGGTEMVDTRRLESVSDAKSWLKGITDELYIEGNNVYDYNGEKILSYDNSDTLLKNLKRDIQKEVGDTNAGGTYQGYVNIENPITIDAHNEIWSKIALDNIEIEGIDNIKEFLEKYGSSVWKESGKLRTSTNDIVAAISDAIDNGDLDVDGVIIKNIYDEGGYGNTTPTEAGTDYITFNSNQFKALDNKTPTSNPDIRYSISTDGKMQDSEGKNITLDGETGNDNKTLLAIHNLTADKLRGVLELGGFPVPSIAITNQKHTSFGNISVIFNKNAIDPSVNEANKVYSRDAYTTRSPKVVNKINENGLKEVAKNTGIEEWNLRENYKEISIEEAIEKLKRNEQILDKYLEKNNIKVEPIYRDFKGFTHLSQNSLQDFINNHKDLMDLSYTDKYTIDTYNKYYNDVHNLFIKDIMQEAKISKEKAELFYKDYPGFNHWDYFIRDLKEVQKLDGNQQLDEYATKEAKEKLVDVESKKYKDFVKSLISPMYGEKYIRNNKDYYTKTGTPRSFNQRYETYTLDNIVKIMNENKGTGQESVFGVGINEIAADASKKFRNIEDIKNSENLLMTQSEEEHEQIYDKYNNEYRDLENSIMDKYSDSSVDGYVWREKAIEDAIKNVARKMSGGKKITSSNVILQFQKNGIEINEKQAQRTIDLVKNLSTLPTNYFEAKPQRAVGFDEIDAIIIPNDLSLDIKQQLKDRGIKTIEYNPNNENERENIINSLNEYKFSKTHLNFDQYLESRIAKKGTRTTLGELRSTYNSAPTADNKLATSEYTKKQNKAEEQKQIAKILDEPVKNQNEKNRTWAILKANIIDKGKVFEELSHKTKNRELQGKWDYMLTSGARGQNAIGNIRYDMDSNNKTKTQISKSLEDIRTEVGKNTSEFQNYMYHQLNIDRMTLQDRFGIDNKPVFGDNISAEYSKQKVAEFEKAHPEFKEYAQDVYDFLDANKKELVDRGVISQELSDKLHELYPHYVPIKRVDAKGAAIKVPLDTFRTGINTPLAKATGGSSDIQPMFQTIADRTLQTYRASARNNFGVELMNTLNSTTESMQTDIDSIIEEIGDENTELLKEGKNGQNPTFTVFNNGEKVTFEITKDMYDALKPQSDIIKNINNSKLAKTGRAISNFRRGVLTEYNPIFSLTNAMKDAQDVVVNSQHPAKTFAKFGESYAQILQKGYWYNEYIQNGGEQNSYFKDGEFTSDKKQSKLKTAIKVPFEAISNVNNVIEMAPRLAEYIASREAGRSIETSMLDAARVTTNFKAGGDWTKTLNRNGATFLNASVQGFQQQIRNIQEANTKGLKGYAALATKYAIAGLPALILNGLIWKDDDDYNDLQDYAKDNYYIIAKYGDGKFIRIPKGRVAATAQKIVSNVTEYLTDDKKSLNIDNLAKDFWEDIKFAQDNIAPNNPLDNNVLSPIFQAMTNKTWYGTDLVPTRLQNKPKKEQYDETTDSLSMWLGNKLNVSPYKINYLLDQYGGGLADITLPRMTKQAENNVFTDKFTTDSVMKNKYPGEFYSELDDLKVKANSIDAKDEDVLKYKYNSSVSSQMSKLYAEKREIQNSNMTDKQKKEQLKVVQGKINNLAREALEGTDTAKISGNTATINDTQYYKTTADDESKWNKVTDKEKEKNQDISLKTYADYKNKVIGKSKDSEKIQVLVDSTYNNKEKLALYENYVNSNDKNISLVKDLNINTDEYLKYKLNAGTKKAEKVSYIENTMRNVSYMNKLMLLGTEYALSSSEKDMVYNYVTGLNKTKAQKLEILSKIKGFTVSDNGTVRY